MSSMASNYDMSRLVTGQALAVVAVVCAVLSTHGISGQNMYYTFLPFVFLVVGYGIMMFASSYVEEEQHFWYWGTAAWLSLLGLKNYNGWVYQHQRNLSRPLLTTLIAGHRPDGATFCPSSWCWPQQDSSEAGIRPARSSLVSRISSKPLSRRILVLFGSWSTQHTFGLRGTSLMALTACRHRWHSSSRQD
jgi:GPI ethanolamine phosphate transferase-like protein